MPRTFDCIASRLPPAWSFGWPLYITCASTTLKCGLKKVQGCLYHLEAGFCAEVEEGELLRQVGVAWKSLQAKDD